MIRFQRPPEPPTFDERVRRPGGAWLREHAAASRGLPAYWRRVAPELRRAFDELCA